MSMIDDPTDPTGLGDPDDPPTSPGGGGSGGSGGSESGTLPPAPSLPAPLPAPRFQLETPGAGLFALIYDAYGFRRNAAQSDRWSPSGQIDRYGGFGQGEITLAGHLNVEIGDRVDLYFDGHHLYRGYVEENSFGSDMPDNIVLTLYGRSTRLMSLDCPQVFLNPSPVDVSKVAQAIFDAWVSPVMPWLSTSFPSVGVQIVGAFNTQGQSVGEAYNALARLCGDRACWGIGIDDSGADLLYFRAIGDLDATDYSLSSPSAGIGRAKGGASIADLKNIVTVTGGDLGLYGQKIVNGSFEHPQPGGGEKLLGNLLLNGSFEDGANQTGIGTGATAPDGSGGDNSGGATGHGYTNYWHLYGGTSTKQSGEDGDGASAQAGSWWIETDDIGEGFSQAFDLPTASRGKPIKASWYARPEQDGDFARATVKIQWRDATSGTWTDAAEGTITIQPSIQAYQPYPTTPVTWASPATADMGRIVCQQTNTVSEGQGIRWDSFCVWDNSIPYQQGWRFTHYGSAEILLQNHVYAAARVEGGYALRAKVVASDASGQDAHLEPIDKIEVIGGQPLRFTGFLASGPDHTSGSQKVLLWVFWFKSDGSSAGSDQYGYDLSAPDATFRFFNMKVVAPNDAVKALPFINYRSNGDWLHDGLTFQDARYPFGASLPYQPQGSFSQRFRAALVCSATSSDPYEVAAQASEANPVIGPRAGAISSPEIAIANIPDPAILYAQASALAKSYFRTMGVPTSRVSVPVSGKAEVSYWPGSSARLVGAAGEAMRPASPLPPGLPIATVRIAIDGAGTLTRPIELGREQVTQEALTMQIAVDVANGAAK